jgi:hypothetical protein
LITRRDENGHTVVVYRTEVVAKNRNPAWAAFELSYVACGGLDTSLTLEVFSFVRV